jgi:4-hydroxy-tetrahydrodipicolinate reductase
VSDRILVIGDGKMGRLVSQLVGERGCELVGMLGPVEMRDPLTRGMADVAIEFTQADAALHNIRACAAIGLPVVSGTTGWDADLDGVGAEVKQAGGALLHAANFSLGVHVFRSIIEAAARHASAAGFSGHIIETHHDRKLDAPSGTAKMLARVAHKAGARDVPITSVRVGHVPGTHEIVYDAPFEQIRLVHEARDRRVFADGALSAARWLIGKRGVFTFDDFVVSLGP